MARGVLSEVSLPVEPRVGAPVTFHGAKVGYVHEAVPRGAHTMITMVIEDEAMNALLAQPADEVSVVLPRSVEEQVAEWMAKESTDG